MLPSTPRSVERDSISKPSGPSLSGFALPLDHNDTHVDKRPATKTDMKESFLKINKEWTQKKALRMEGVDDEGAIQIFSPRMPLQNSREATGCVGAGQAWLLGVGKGRIRGQPAAGRPSISSRM
jgi:hypothetical protein